MAISLPESYSPTRLLYLPSCNPFLRTVFGPMQLGVLADLAQTQTQHSDETAAMSYYTGVLKGGPDGDDVAQSHGTEETAPMSYATGVLRGGSDDDGSGGAPAQKKSAMKIKRVKSSDMLRMQIDEMMFDADEKEKKAEADRAAEKAKFEADLAAEKAKFYAEMAEQKAKFDADKAKSDADAKAKADEAAEQKAKADLDTANQKARADAEKEYLRARINELRGEVQAAEKAKAVSDAKLHSVSSNDMSIATKSTASEERLQRQVDDGKAEREALEEKISAMQAEIETAAKRKEAAKAAAKRDRDALEKQVSDLRKEVEETEFSKYLIGQELEEAKRMSSDSNSSTDASDEKVAELEKQLKDLMASKKAGDDAGAAREAKLEADAVAQKEAGDAREKELKNRLAAMLEEADEAAFKKLANDEQGQAIKEELERQVRALQMEVESAMSAKKKSDVEKDTAVSAKLKSDKDKDAAVSELDRVRESSSNESSSEEVSDLRKQLFKMKAKNNDLRTERALIESFAIAREEEDRDEMDRALEDKERAVEEKAKEVEALRTEMQSVMTAKLKAERERDMAISETVSSVTGFTDERALALEMELEELLAAKEAAEEDAATRERELEAAVEDMKTKQRADQDVGAAREKELKDQVDSLLEKAHEAKSRKLISDGEHKAAMDEAVAKEGELMKRLKFLQEEVEQAVFDKHLADEELGKLKSSSASQSDASSAESTALAARLKAYEDEVQALKDAAAKDKIDRDVELKASQDENQALIDAAFRDKATSKTEHKAEMDELKEKLLSLQSEVDSAVFAKILAESELDKAMSSSSASTASSSEAEKIAMLRKELYGTKIASKAKEDAGAARERKLASDLQTIKEEADTAAKANRDDALVTSLANKGEVERLVKALQDETKAKLKAEQDLNRAMSDSVSSATSSSDAHVSSLQKELDDLKASKSASDQAGAAREKKLETDVAEVLSQLEKLQGDADAAADAAAAKASVDIAEIAALKDAAAKAKATSKKEHKAEMDELQEELKALQGEVETAVFAKVLAESELDKAMSSSISSGSSSEVEKIAMLRKELYNAKIASKAEKDAGAARERKLASDLKTITEDAGTAALANEEEIERLVKALQGETQARHEAEKELQRNTSDSASSAASSSDAHVSSLQKELDDIKASKSASDRAGAARERKLEADVAEGVALEQKLQDEKKALLSQLEKMQEDVDKAAFDNKASMDKAAASEEKMQQRLKFLQEEMDAVVYEKHLSDMEVDRLKTSPGSQTSGSDNDMVAAQLRAENNELRAEKKLDSDKAAQEKTWADEAILQLKQELGFLQEQAAVLSRGKEIAEDEVRALKVSSDGSTTTPSDESPEAILLQKIEQLKSEKNLSYSIATTMKKQLESGKKNLQDRLAAMTSAKKEADDKLDAQNEKLSKEIKDLKAQKKVDGLELQKKIDALEKELRNARSSSGGTGSDDGSCEKGQVDKLMHDLAEMKTEKDATEKRLAWEKSTKRDLRQQILALQERARAADRAKKISEDELRELQEQSETQTSESMEEVAEKLRQQVQSLQEEKGFTLQKLAELEEAVASGDLDFGEGGRVREAYVDKLKHDIEKLETSVDDLSSENKLLLDSKLRLEGEMSKDDKAKFISLDDEIRNLSRQTRDLTQKLGSARKEADDAKVAQKEEKDQVIDLQARMDKTILQLATIKSSTRMNMERIKGEHEQELKAVRDSSASLALHTENDELRRERDELRKALSSKTSVGTEQTLEDAESLTSAALAELRDMLNKAQEENAALKKESAALKGQLEEKDGQLNEHEKEVSRLEHSLNEANAKNHDLERNIEAIKSKDEIFLSRIERGADAEKASLMKRIEVSEKAHADRMAHHEKENGTLRKKLESAEREIAELRASTGKQMQDSALPLQNGNSVDMLEVSQLRNDLKKESDQRKRAEHEAVSLKASMEQYDTTMDYMRREMMELRSKRDETVARLKDENQKLQKENQAMNEAGVRMSTVITAGEAPASTDLVSTVVRDLDSLILDLQGPPSGFATNGTNMLAPSQNGHAVPGAFRTNGMDARVSAIQENHFVSRVASASVSVQQMSYFAEELERMTSIANDYKLLYESKCVAFKEVQMERNALCLELQKYCGTQ